MGKFLGTPVQGQSNPLPSALAQQGGVPSAGAQAMRPQQQVPVGTPGGLSAQITRHLANMRTTPRTPILGSFRTPQQASPPSSSETPANPETQPNPFLRYLNQMSGANAQRNPNPRFPSYLRNLPIAANRTVNPMSGTQNPYNITIPQQFSIPTTITSQIGSTPLPNTQPYVQINAPAYTPPIQQGGSTS